MGNINIAATALGFRQILLAKNISRRWRLILPLSIQFFFS